jgi:hypothetical protein
VRDAVAHILDNTTLADLIAGNTPRFSKGRRAKRKQKGSLLPMVVGGQKSE